ncbi:FAD:protein FMN transferase [Ketobacter sp. MCCC 1A13808]|nr:FAD:protein FMN transferase [Ketobacter sp. MCCC 1A13808]MVF12655.1 FAD:protein FMN transferase [Ketobacter sp. MCCC 1A13808]RLP55814.1 MAG: FAD:protein FMN transferase [Ketobacter sp.]
MGTRVYVELWWQNEARANELMQQVMDEMERINQLMSPYKTRSELSAINRLASEQAVPVSAELFRLIQTSVRYSDVSDGAFDITFASLGSEYDYRNKIKPTESQRKKAAALINYRDMVLLPADNSVRFRKKGMRIDLGGIAKGYAVDNAIAILQAAGVESAIVTAGGDSRILGDHRGRPWLLGIHNPRGDGQVLKLPLEDVSISTSGDYERYFEADGVRYHHIIDPHKGASPSELMSASVLTDKSIDADALSTTLFVLGTDKALKLANSQPGVSAILIDRTGKVYYSSDLVDPAMQ